MGLHEQFLQQQPAQPGLFEQVCKKLFQITLDPAWGNSRQQLPPLLAEAAAIATYQEWENQAVEVVRRLPLEYSQAVYNFTKTQEATNRGRQGMVVPQTEKRSKYVSVACSFLYYCANSRKDSWATADSIMLCWIGFLQCKDHQERKAKIASIASYIRHRIQSKVSPFVVGVVHVYKVGCKLVLKSSWLPTES
jgi:hypothetical protein